MALSGRRVETVAPTGPGAAENVLKRFPASSIATTRSVSRPSRFDCTKSNCCWATRVPTIIATEIAN
jgi:hypothetical protein